MSVRGCIVTVTEDVVRSVRCREMRCREMRCREMRRQGTEVCGMKGWEARC